MLDFIQFSHVFKFNSMFSSLLPFFFRFSIAPDINVSRKIEIRGVTMKISWPTKCFHILDWMEYSPSHLIYSAVYSCIYSLNYT